MCFWKTKKTFFRKIVSFGSNAEPFDSSGTKYNLIAIYFDLLAAEQDASVTAGLFANEYDSTRSWLNNILMKF